MNISELFSPELLQQCIAERLVVARDHPHILGLRILNYSAKCTYTPGAWNEVTLQCRGLIHDQQGKVLARPFRKFFNHDQPEAPSFGLDEPVTVTDKLDGSLGILYPAGERHAISTRGSFESHQAIHATELIQNRYAHFCPPPGWTLLFEIVFPENRVVLDYGDMDDLILLGAVNIESGETRSPSDELLSQWDGPRAAVFNFSTLRDALSAPLRPNAEGFVVTSDRSGERVKIKQADYVALHRIVTGLNEWRVWEHLKDAKPLGDLLSLFPDEFHPWIAETAKSMSDRVDEMREDCEAEFSDLRTALPDDFERRAFAMRARDSERATQLFSLLDRKDIRPSLWKLVEPSGCVGPRVVSEATA